jgi:ABC-type glycerol-3-phosphate transport system substrate-binding protein
MSKRTLALLLGALLVAMLAFTTACGGGDDDTETPAATVAPEETTAPDETGTEEDPTDVEEDPVDEVAGSFPETLSIWGTNIAAGGIGADTNDAVWAWREIQELTGTDITWIHPTYGDADAFTLMIAAGNWPDIIQTNWLNVPGGPGVYYLDRVIIRLNDLIYSYMPNYLAALNATGVRHAIEMGENRDMLFLSGIQQPYQLAVIGPQIRQEWLEHVGLPVPTTTDELTQVLRAFRDNPLNPDNDDVRPMTGFGVRALGAGATNFGMEMNLWPFGTSLNFYHIDGTVTFGPMTEAFEDAVRWLRMLMEEGLIDEEWSVNERVDSDGRFMEGISGFMPGIQMTGMHNTMAANHSRYRVQRNRRSSSFWTRRRPICTA